jgi:hypothetical protein
MIESQNPNVTGRVGRPVLWLSASITPNLTQGTCKKRLVNVGRARRGKASKQRHTVASGAKGYH